MFKKLSLVLLLFLSTFAAVPAFAVDINTRDELIIGPMDNGGNISDHWKWWEYIRTSNLRVRIDGDCISACTMFLNIIPLDRVCLTERAALGIHLASSDGGPDVELSEHMQRIFYPDWVNKWLKDRVMTEDITFMYPKDIVPHIKMCDGKPVPEPIKIKTQKDPQETLTTDESAIVSLSQ